nr:VCBS [uncultured bacterium]
MVDCARRQYACARVVFVLLFIAGFVMAPPVAAQTILVPAGGDLQAALDVVQPGGTVLVEAGATFAGKYTIGPKVNPDGLYITLRSSADPADLPAPGVRMTPAYAHLLPKIRSTDTLQGLHILPGASYWRLECLEFPANVNGAGDILRVGSHLETVAANQPHHIILDRLYVHGDAAIGQRNGVVAHAADFVLRDSYISDIKQPTVETHAFTSYNGPGPYLIENNYLEASSINIMFGGTDPRNVEMVPSDITIRRNHVAKNLHWMQPRAQGGFWNVKNLFELKLGRRVLIEGNVFEHNWFGAGDQAGYAVLLRTESQSGSCTFCETGEVTFQNNIIRHSPAGLSLVGLDFNVTPAGIRMHDVVIRNNLFDDLDRGLWRVRTTIPTTRFSLVNGVDRLTLDHNTIIMPNGTGVIAFSGSYDSPGFVFTNNMTEHKTFGVKGDAVTMGTASLNAFTAPGYTFAANVLAGGSASLHPPGNFFPSVATWTAGFLSYAGGNGGNYRLLDGGPYKGAATDGRDLGADIDRIEAGIAQLSNYPPIAFNSAVTVEEDTPIEVTLRGSDPNGDPITYRIGSTSPHVQVTGEPPNVTYTGAPNFNGRDSFTFLVEDGSGRVAIGTVTVTITPVNDPPMAPPQLVAATEDTPTPFTLAAGDPDGDPLTYVVGEPASGVLSGVPPNLTYTANVNFNGEDSFTYTVTDGLTPPVTGIVTLTVAAVNDAPVPVPLSVTTKSEKPLIIGLSATDVEGDVLTWSASAPRYGTLTGTPPNVTYASFTDFVGIDQFTFTVSDGLSSATASVTIAVTGGGVRFLTDQLPDARAGKRYSEYLQAEDGAGPYTFAIAGGALPPGLTLEPDGRISGIAMTAGTYSFIAQVTDRWDQTSTKEFTIQVSP